MSILHPDLGVKLISTPESPRQNDVLIAEDDPMSRRVLERWLQRWEYRVIALKNGVEAWTVLQQKDAPQMVILDWMMPGLEGIELCRRIRSEQAGRYKYVLLLTAKGSKADIVAGLEAGADDYLTKPFDCKRAARPGARGPANPDTAGRVAQGSDRTAVPVRP